MAANPIYIETEEEIPEVIERVRLSTAEDTTLVLPTRSRFGQSRFNFQLLRQYASGMGKRVAIVSPDPAVQQMAEEHGFRSYRAVELVGGEAEPESGAGIPTAGTAAAAEGPLPLPPPRPAGGVAPAPRMVMGAPARLPSRVATEMRPGHTLLYAGAGLLLIAGLVAGFIYVPAADITLTAAATSFEQPVTVDAQPGQPPVRVRAAKVEKTASGAFKATGTQKVPGALATGSVVYTNSCGPDLVLRDGYRLRGAGGIQFTQVGDVSVANGKSSSPAPIKATSPGANGNLPAGAITTIENNYGGTNCLTVTNPAPTSGGVDDKTNTIIQPSDLDTARQGLEAQLRKDIGDELARGLQPGEKLAESPLFSPPDFNPDHKLGDVVTGFNATLRLSAEGAYYNEADVQKAFADGLARKVPADKSLTDNRVVANYTVDQGSGAHMTFRGTARSFLAPRIDFNRLSGQLAAKSTGQAKAVLGKLPVESADLKQTPVRLPFMPLSSSRIHIRYVVEQGAAPAASPAPRKSP